MKKNFSPKKSIDEQKFEVELKKIKLNLEFGMEFADLPDKNTLLEVESEFLDYIEQFEREYNKCKMVQVYEFIGKPEFPEPNKISPEQLSVELERLLDILSDNSIRVDTLCEVDDIEMYRFITEELLFVEMDDIRIAGMMHCYIYEEFHPNHDYDIRNYCTDFVETLFRKDTEFNLGFISLTENIETRSGLMNEQNFIKRIIDFRESFSSMTLHSFEITSVEINDSSAQASFLISYSMRIEGSCEEIIHCGDGKFGLVLKYDYWNISKVDIPGTPLFN